MNIIQFVYNKFIDMTLLYWPRKTAHDYIYRRQHNGKSINWSNPQTYDELIHIYNVTTYNSKFSKYADKLEVRKYVEECGFKQYLIPLLGGPYRSFDEICFSKLPNEFIIKTTHASGPLHYYICKDKTKLDKEKLHTQFDMALKDNFARHHNEYQYKSIEPRIIIEQLLHDTTERMTDYKVVCSYGKPIAILVCSDRDQGRDYFDINWNYLDYAVKTERSKCEIHKPQHLLEMIDAASVLSKKFPLARIDFYDTENGLYFGEITLSPSAGYHPNINEKGQIELARAIIASEKE